LTAAFGEPVPLPASRFEPRDHRRIWNPGPGFPEAWISVEIFAGTLLEHVHERLTELRAGGDESATQVHEELGRQAQSWAAKARAKGSFSPVGGADWTAFWSWCEALARSATEPRTRTARSGFWARLLEKLGRRKKWVDVGVDLRSPNMLNKCNRRGLQSGAGLLPRPFARSCRADQRSGT
jgi:hypothetical protein